MHIDSSDPSVLAIDTPDVTVTPGVARHEFTVHPLRLGNATVSLVPPPGYLAFPATQNFLPSSVDVTVDGVKLTLSAPSSVGKDLQGLALAGTEFLPQPITGLVYTVTSSDPSRLLVSSSAATPGTAQATGSTAQVYLQALSNSGTVTLTVSSPAAQPASTSVQLTGSAVVFNNVNTPLNLPVNGPTQHLQVQLASLNPSSSEPTCCQDPRPGWTGSVTVTSSDPKVAAVTPASVQLPGSGPQYVDIKPGAAGTAIVSLGLLPGSDPPASGRQIVGEMSGKKITGLRGAILTSRMVLLRVEYGCVHADIARGGRRGPEYTAIAAVVREIYHLPEPHFESQPRKRICPRGPRLLRLD